MQFLEMVKREPAVLRRDIIIAATVSGIANSALLVIVNAAANDNDPGPNWLLVVLFVVAMVLFVLGFKITYKQSSTLFAGMIHRIRVRISEKICSAELSTLEALGKVSIYHRLTQETETISQAQRALIGCLQAAVMLLFVLIYIYTLSPVSFLLVLAMCAGQIKLGKQKDMVRKTFMVQAMDKSVALLGRVNHLLAGFKQVKVRERLGDELELDIAKASEEVMQDRNQLTHLTNKSDILTQGMLYLLLGAVVFVLPRIVPTHHSVVSEMTASILFLFGPLGQLSSAVYTLEKANVAAASIAELEKTLDFSNNKTGVFVPLPESLTALSSFEQITITELEYSYRDQKGNDLFKLGPLNLDIRRGELLYVIGANGSGKSSFLKLLTGLYEAQAGRIKIDGELLTPLNRQNYRELFSVIFGDFHLFDRLYGLPAVSREAVLGMLKDLELAHKTSYDGDRFSGLQLSTGQRRRIALLVSFLEDRPICVYDEWAADQDPQFRKHFYENILPELKRQGKAVIAVTHDDHYFHLADRLLKLDYGSIEFIKNKDQSG